MEYLMEHSMEPFDGALDAILEHLQHRRNVAEHAMNVADSLVTWA